MLGKHLFCLCCGHCFCQWMYLVTVGLFEGREGDNYCLVIVDLFQGGREILFGSTVTHLELHAAKMQ